jgi:hypothetical protein
MRRLAMKQRVAAPGLGHSPLEYSPASPLNDFRFSLTHIEKQVCA